MSDLQKFLDELRAKISIVDVVGDKVKLVRKGREHTGLCPFHNEKTPSFTVNEVKGFYHCFGCGAHGDIVKFEMEANNLPFMEAVNKLAAKAGVSVPQMSRENPAETEKKNSQHDIMEMAVKFFEKNLRLVGGQKALEYLYNRGFDDDLIAKFRLGYAPSSNGLKAQLTAKGVAEHDLMELGLASMSESSSGRMFDFFRDRVIIPIFDKKGRPIAFGGRALGDAQPKYLNSPETPLFNKRRNLYNMNLAREKAYEAQKLVICEGYMDVMALDKYGFSYAVAPLGTALTEEQIVEAWKVCNEPVLCFDGDNAGVKAAMRSVDRALPILKAGYSLKFAFLPDKMDPDDFLKAKGAKEFENILNATKPLSELLWQKNILDKIFDTPEQKALIEKNIMEDVAKINDEKVRSYYLAEMKNLVYKNLGRSQYVSNKKPKAKINRPNISLDSMVARFVAAAVVAKPELIGFLEEKLSIFEFKDEKFKQLWEAAREIYAQNDKVVFAEMYEKLQALGMTAVLRGIADDVNYLQKEKDLALIREGIELKLVEIQLKQVEAEIRECSRKMQEDESCIAEVGKRYESLKEERNALLDHKLI